MTGYYRSFIQDYSHLAEPLIALSRGNIVWEWTAACQSAFQTLRGRLSSAPVLAYPDWGKPFILQTDASDVAVGAILAQLDGNGKERSTNRLRKSYPDASGAQLLGNRP